MRGWLVGWIVVVGCGGEPSVTAGGTESGTGDASSDGSDEGPKLDVGSGACDPGGDARDVGPLEVPMATLGFNAAWMDPGYGLTFYDHGRAYVAFADADGALSGTTVELAPTGLFPRVAYSGGALGIVYVDRPTEQGPDTLRFARVAAGGAVLSDVAVAPGEGTVGDPDIVFHPLTQEWGAAWTQDSVLRFARVGLDGDVMAQAEVDLPDAPSLIQLGDSRALAWTPDGYAIAVASADAVHLLRLDKGGALVAASQHPTAVQPFNATVAVGEASFGVAWQASSDNQGFRVFFATADAEGNLLSDTERVWGQLGDPSIGNPTVIFDGQRYHAVWTADDAVGNSHLWHGQPEGDGLSSELVTLAPRHAWFPQALWNGCELVVAYGDTASGADAEGHLLFIPAELLPPEG